MLKARQWSNEQLKKIASNCFGDIINVSAMEDSDKTANGHYSEYFYNARSYTITNYIKNSGLKNIKQIELNLENDLPDELYEKYDVVFNHTALEHIYDMQKAFDNLCKMSKRMVILVVPKIQDTHIGLNYLDYWRFTEPAIEKMFEARNFSVIYMDSGGSSAPYEENDGIYIFCVAIRN